MKSILWQGFGWSLLAAGGIISYNCGAGQTGDEPVPETHTVLIEQMKYHPEEVTVHPGDTILFVNKDLVAHDVTQSDQEWASPMLEMDDSWKFVPQKSDDYYCSIHLVMKGKIRVTE